MAKVLVVGSINMDLVVRVPHSPRPGETVLGGDFETFPGGKGANQAVAAARMGGEVTMVGRVAVIILETPSSRNWLRTISERPMSSKIPIHQPVLL